MSATLLYVHDPMCSWCWAFRPTWQRIQAELPEGIEVRRLLGGLAPDTDRAMPEEMRAGLQATWRRIQGVVPGTRFNFDFWRDCSPRRATYPACRAVIAAGRQDGAREEAMIEAIQHAYYLEARNPSEEATLVALAREVGLDGERFAADLADPSVHAELERQVAEARSLGADSFPTLLMLDEGGARWLPHDYNDPVPVLRQIQRMLAA